MGMIMMKLIRLMPVYNGVSNAKSKVIKQYRAFGPILFYAAKIKILGGSYAKYRRNG